MSREEKIAFFINVYNMLVIHATVVRGPPKNTAERLSECPPRSQAGVVIRIPLHFTGILLCQ
eukprot:4902888-Pyramimonas_sp.AAC.1